MGWKTAAEPTDWECPQFMRLAEKGEEWELWNCISEYNANMLR